MGFHRFFLIVDMYVYRSDVSRHSQLFACAQRGVAIQLAQVHFVDTWYFRGVDQIIVLI